MSRLRRFVIAAVLACIGGLALVLALGGGNSASGAPICNTNWIGASGLWSNPANWDAGVPTSATSACIVKNGNYTVTIDFAGAQAASVIVGDPANATPTQTLQIGTAPLAGSLSTSGSSTSKLTPKGRIRVLNGSMSIDGGQTFAESGGSLVVDPGQTFQITSGDTYQWSGGANTGDAILINGGSVALSGSPTGALRHINSTYLTGNVPAGVSMTLEASACSYGSDLYINGNSTNNGTITLTDVNNGCGGYDVHIYSAGSPVTPYTLTNNGTINLAPGSGGRRDIGTSFNNASAGVLNVNGAGRLVRQIAGGAIRNSGTINIAAAATLEVTSYGGETFTQSAGTVSNLGTFVLHAGPRYLLTGGTLTGNAVLFEGNTIDFTAAGSPTGKLIARNTNYLKANIPAGIELTLETRACYYGSDLNLLGDVVNHGTLRMTDVTDGCGGASESHIYGYDVSPPRKLSNDGTVLLEAGNQGGFRDIAVSFDNLPGGTLSVTGAGRLYPYPSGGLQKNSGTINISPNASLEVTNSGQTFTMAGGTVSNQGSFTFRSGPGLTFTAGTISGNPVILEGNALTFTGGTAQSGSLLLHNANSLNGNVPAAISLTVEGSACYYASYLYLDSNVTNNGTITMTDASTVCGGVNSDIYSTGDADPSYTITNNGTFNVLKGNQGGRRNLQASLVNTSTGTVNVTSEDFYQYGRSVSLTNSGTINVAAGATYGLYDYAGPRTVTFTAGTVTNAGTMVFNSATTAFNGGTLTNNGSLTFNYSSLSFSGGALTGNRAIVSESTVNLTGATAAISGFIFRGTNHYLGTVPAATSLTVEASACYYGSYLYLDANVTNNGTITLTDISTICGGINSDIYSNGDADPSYTITNNGTFNALKGNQGGTRNLQASLVNTSTGTINVTSENFYHYGRSVSLTNSGTINVAAGATYGLYDSAGPRTVTFTAGTVTNAGTMVFNSATTAFNGGTLANNGSLTFNYSTLSFSGGALTGNRAIVSESTVNLTGATAAISGFIFRGTNHYLGTVPSATTLTVEASACYYGSYLYLDANVTNNGTITMTDVSTLCGAINSDIYSNGDADPSYTITNNGAFNVLKGNQGGRRNLQASLVNTSTGTVNVTSEDLFHFGRSVSLTNSGTINVAAGASWYQYNSAGPKTWTFAAGTVTNSGAFGTDSADVSFNGGTITGNPIRLGYSTLNLNSTNQASFALYYTSTLTDSSPASVTVGALQRIDLLEVCSGPTVNVSGALVNYGLIQTVNENCGYNATLRLGPAGDQTLTNNGILRTSNNLVNGNGGGFYLQGALDMGAPGRLELLQPNMPLVVDLAGPDFPGGTLSDGTWVLRSAAQIPGAGPLTTNAATIDLSSAGDIFDRTTGVSALTGNLATVASAGTLIERGTYQLATAAPFSVAGRVSLFDDSRLNVPGAASLAAGSNLDVEVTSATAMGRLAATGTVTIDPAATLNISTDPAYDPASGATHDVVMGSAVSGTYTFPANVHGWDIGVNGKAYLVQYPPPGAPTLVRLTTLQRTVTVGRPAATVPEQSGPAVFNITLNVAPELSGTTSVSASTFVPSGAGVHAVPGQDYTAISGQAVTWNAGETAKTVSVTLNNDAIDEYDEDLGVIVTPTSTNLVLGAASITRAIADDDAAPVASITADAALVEGPGVHRVAYSVGLVGRSEKNVLIDWATADGGAHAPRDYTAAGARITVPKLPGSTEVVSSLPAVITIEYLSNPYYSNVPGTFNVNLTAPDDTVTPHPTTGSITSTIPNTVPPPGIAITGGRRVTEAATTADLPLFLTARADVPITVGFASAPGTATAGSDYTATSGTVTFAAGETNKTIPVTILADNLFENDETFTVTLSSPSPSGVTLLSGSDVATVTIANDDAAPVLSISGPSPVAETATARVYTITKTGATQLASAVAVNLVPGTANVPTDVTGAGTTLSFAAADTSKTFTATVVADTLDEPNETYSVQLSSPSNATLGTASVTTSITDDDPTPTLTPANRSVPEAAGSVAVPITLSAASGRTVTVHYDTANGSGAAGTDYTATSGDLTFDPGVTERSVTVPVLNNSGDQPDRTFLVNLTLPANATLASSQATVTIVDDDATPSLSIAGPSPIAEGNSGTTPAGFTATLSAASLQPVTVHVASSDGTATIADYNGVNTDVTFNPGETSKPVTPTVIGDLLDEVNETFSVALSLPSNATIGTASAAATITDDDATPSVSVSSPASLAEGSTGTTPLAFSVTLSAASGQVVAVSYATGGTATAGPDYGAQGGILSFAPGETTKTITVNVVADTIDEPDETVSLILSSPAAATLGTATATTTITDDDATPAVSVSPPSPVIEGNSGTTNAVFNIALSSPSGQTVTVSATSANGTATAPADYTALGATTVTFNPGEVAKTVTVPIVGDAADEPDESFSVTLTSPSNATVGTASATATILDDDGAPALSISGPATVTENVGSAAYTVTLLPASNQTVTVTATVVAGTASVSSDVAGGPVTLSFAPGETSKPFNAAVVNDTVPEGSETYSVQLSGPANATFGTASVTTTILDDDGQPVVSVGDASVTEGTGAGTTTAIVPFSLDRASGLTVTVAYATTSGTATSGADFTPTTGSFTFSPGQTLQNVVVPIDRDAIDELDETFTVTASSPSNATVGDGSGTVTIIDDDFPPTLGVSDATNVTEVVGGADQTFTVTLSSASQLPVSVTAATSPGTAASPGDYTAVSTTVTFPVGSTTQNVVVHTLDDALDEANETYDLVLSAPVNATLADGTGTGTIVDNDAAPTISIADPAALNESSASMTFTATLSAPSGQAVQVAYQTEGIEARSGVDFIGQAGVLVFAPGQTARTIVVGLSDDAVDENSETFEVRLDQPVNVTLVDGLAVGRINDNDATPKFSVSDASTIEGNSGNTTMQFTITLAAASERALSITYSTAPGTATDGSDYTGKTDRTISFAPGVTSVPVFITIKGNTVVEADETFFLNLVQPVSNIADAQGVGTILNDD